MGPKDTPLDILANNHTPPPYDTPVVTPSMRVHRVTIDKVEKDKDKNRLNDATKKLHCVKKEINTPANTKVQPLKFYDWKEYTKLATPLPVLDGSQPNADAYIHSGYSDNLVRLNEL
jgi:hypothetical protein